MDQTQHEKSDDKRDGGTGDVRRFIRTHGPVIGLVTLIGYVILLGIGVIAEVFNIQWVLDWWIWSPPGKFR